jgi:26S proteasome regulatory subunit N1
MKRQLAFLLARAQVPYEWVQPQNADGDVEGEELPFDMVDALSNTKLSSYFRLFGKELGVEEPKSLEDIYKTHLENTRELSPFLPYEMETD